MHKIYKISKIAVWVVFFLFGLISKAGSDTIYLKNGRNIKGLIKSENEKGVVLDLGFGTVQFSQEEIKSIDRSNPEESGIIRQEWQRYKESQAQATTRAKREDEPKEVKFTKTTEGIIVNALLNKKVKAALVLDTGAFAVLLSQRIGKELGLETEGGKAIIKKIVMADGSETEARFIVLDSVDVEGIEARNIEAVVLLKEDVQRDGLLGRSFLNKFNFQIDSVNKKLILKKLEAQNIWEKTRYFSIAYPSDWEKSLDKGKLIIFGPALLQKETEFYRPCITVEKDLDENALNYAKVIREWYNSLRDSPDIRHKMSGLLEKSFKRSYPQAEFVSSDFQEEKDILILYISYLLKKYNGKVCSAKVITKEGSVKSYNLDFLCADKYFDEYLPVFSKCLESFTINE